MNIHIISHVARLCFLALLLACFTACSKDDVVEDNADGAPQHSQGGQVANVPSDAHAYNVSIPATFGGADTRAVEFDNGTLVSKFLDSDEVYVYNVTKTAWEVSPLSLDDISEDGMSCTLTGTISNADEDDELRLFYNINSSTKTFDYDGQNGSLANASQLDFAEGTMKVKTISEGNITLSRMEGETEVYTVSFENLQSMYKFSFPDLAVDIESLNISFSNNRFVTSFNPVDGSKVSSSSVTINLDNAARTSNGNGIVYAALRFDTDNVTPIDDVVFDVTGTNSTHYYYSKHMPSGGFANGNYYDLVFKDPAAPTNLASVSVVNNVYTAKRGEVLTGTLNPSYGLNVPDGASVTLKDATIGSITLEGNATIILADGSENTASEILYEDDSASIPSLSIRGYYEGTGVLTVSDGIDCGNITISNATVNINNDIQAGGSLVIDRDASVTVDNIDASAITIDNEATVSAAGIVATNLSVDNGGQVTVNGAEGEAAISISNMLTVNNTMPGERNSSVIVTDGDISASGINVSGDVVKQATITTENGSISAVVVNLLTDGSSVQANGSDGQTGLIVGQSLTVNAGVLTAIGGDAVETNGNGFAGISSTNAVTITVSGGTLEATGGEKDGDGVDGAGISLADGSSIELQNNEKFYADDTANPHERVETEVTAADYTSCDKRYVVIKYVAVAPEP